MAGLASRFADLAKRSLPTSSEFSDLIRAIGESKSKDEETAIVSQMLAIARARLREGRSDSRSVREVLTYLMYIEMLGFDTSWAHASVIRYCSDKNLHVKKARTRSRPRAAEKRSWPGPARGAGTGSEGGGGSAEGRARGERRPGRAAIWAGGVLGGRRSEPETT